CNSVIPGYRERFSPIALPAECGITHLVVHLSLSDTEFFNLIYDDLCRFPHLHTIQEIGIFKNGILCRIGFFAVVITPNDVCDGNVEMLRETVIAFIARRDSHYRTGAVS